MFYHTNTSFIEHPEPLYSKTCHVFQILSEKSFNDNEFNFLVKRIIKLKIAAHIKVS